METAFLGASGVRVSRLCLGTMAFGGDADEATSAAIYGRARDAGINFFDCADVYAGGRSEEILGRLVAPHRDEVVVTTKAYFPTGSGANDRGGWACCPTARWLGAVLGALQAGDIDTMLALAPECVWSEGRSWEEGFNEALGVVLEASAELLADYHVCNNDAVLQASMWARFVDTGEVTACDEAAATCSGPLWFYIPE